jgi:hypothetical protein
MKPGKQFRGGEGMASGGTVKVCPRNGIQNFRVSFPEALETRNFWTLRNGDPTLTLPRPTPRCAAKELLVENWF